jgi:hypothetical protein
MHIVVAGGTGFLGGSLVSALRADGHDVVVLTRQEPPRPGHAVWNPDGTVGPWARVVDGAGAIVNLAGASIASGRWSDRRKRELVDSRVLSTRSLARAIAAADRPPSVFVAGSAVGFYGPRGDAPVTEQDPPGDDFLGRLGVAWEAAAAATGPRVVLLRTGLALAPDGGVLARMLPAYRFGAGGPFGDGRQFMPWIHRQDRIDLVRWILVTGSAQGPLNAAAPVPVTNAEFSATLARVLGRPHLLRTPAFALRLALGELSEALLTGQRVVPQKAEALGFRFRWPTLEAALRDLLGRAAG